MPLKFNLCTGVLLTVLSTAQAQNKNSVLVELSGAYHQRSLDNDTGSFFKPASVSRAAIAARVGYSFTQHLSAGLIAEYTTADNIEASYTTVGGLTYYTTAKERTYGWAAGIYGRYTYSVNNWLFIYGQLDAEKYKISKKVLETSSPPVISMPGDYTLVPDPADGIAARLLPCIGLNVARGFGIDLSVGGIQYNQYSNDNVQNSTFSVTLGQQFRLGLHKFIK